MEKGEKGIQKKREEIISNYIYKQLIWNGKEKKEIENYIE